MKKKQMYHELELISESVPQPKLNGEAPVAQSRRKLNKLPLLSWFSSAWEILFDLLTRGDEPQIRLLDHTNDVYWHVYDPRTGQSAWLDSEADVRRWLEQRYYRER